MKKEGFTRFMSINTLLSYLDKRSSCSEKIVGKEKILEKDISNLPYSNLPNQKGMSSKPVAIPTDGISDIAQ